MNTEDPYKKVTQDLEDFCEAELERLLKIQEISYQRADETRTELRSHASTVVMEASVAYQLKKATCVGAKRDAYKEVLGQLRLLRKINGVMA
ncbi:MAG: hypothetical protein ACO23H_03120 [Alphaproteobacteria bacterium]